MAQAQAIGNLTDVALYETARVGIWRQANGQRQVVMVKGVCNQEGHSPTVIFGDDQLQTQTASINDVQVLGVLEIPPSIDQIRRAFGDLLQGDAKMASTSGR